MFAASIDQLPFASPHIGHADSPTARAWIWSAACSLSADGISCDSFSPRAGRRRRAGGAAGSTSAACRHWGAGRGTSLAPFLLCLLSFFLLFFAPTWPPGSPAPVPRQPRSRTGRLFYMAIRLCSGAAHASQPRPAGPRPPRAALAPPPCGDAGLFWNSGPSPPYAPTAPPTAAFGPSAMCSSTPPLPPKGEPKEPPAPLAFDLSSPFKRRKAEFPAPHAAQGGQWSPQVHPRPNNEISINFLTNHD